MHGFPREGNENSVLPMGGAEEYIDGSFINVGGVSLGTRCL